MRNEGITPGSGSLGFKKSYRVDSMFKQIQVHNVDDRYENRPGIVLFTAVDEYMRVTPFFVGVLHRVNAENYAAMDRAVGEYLISKQYISSVDWQDSVVMIDDGLAEKKAYLDLQNKFIRICWFHTKKAISD